MWLPVGGYVHMCVACLRYVHICMEPVYGHVHKSVVPAYGYVHMCLMHAYRYVHMCMVPVYMHVHMCVVFVYGMFIFVWVPISGYVHLCVGLSLCLCTYVSGAFLWVCAYMCAACL